MAGLGAARLAVMAMQPRSIGVHGKVGIAVFAVGDPATVVAHQGWCKASTIEKNQNLITLGQLGTHRFNNRLGKAGVELTMANIHQLPRGLYRATVAALY